MFDHVRAGNAKGKIGSRQGTGERIAILTGVPTSPCTNPYGDYFLGISLRNKQDYARLHGYELHLMAESVDSTIRAGPWQKVALLHQVGGMKALDGTLLCHCDVASALTQVVDVEGLGELA